MKKKAVRIIGEALIAAVLTLMITGCGNYQLIDTTYNYDKAIIVVGGETVTVKIKSWRSYEDGEYQIEATDGTVYLVHISNCTIIKSAEEM